jgi:hypothetical protein
MHKGEAAETLLGGKYQVFPWGEELPLQSSPEGKSLDDRYTLHTKIYTSQLQLPEYLVNICITGPRYMSIRAVNEPDRDPNHCLKLEYPKASYAQTSTSLPMKWIQMSLIQSAPWFNKAG